MNATFRHEVASLGLPAAPVPGPAITATELAPLPEAARRYAAFMGVVGRPRDWSLHLCGAGRFRLGPDRPWMAITCEQYNTRLELARVFHMQAAFFGFVPVYVRDTYLAGHGRMLARVLDRFTMVDARGPELDTSELITWLNDAVMFAPSMLLGPETHWTGVDARTFDVSLANAGRSVTARVFVDERGAVTDFSTTDRFYQRSFKEPWARMRWTTPIDGWQTSAGRPIPTAGAAIWHLPAGAFSYAEFRFAPDGVAFNVPPGG